MSEQSVSYRELLSACIDPNGPVHWLSPEYIAVTGLDGGAIVLPLKRFDLLDPALRVAIRLRLTQFNMVVMAPALADKAPSAGSAMVESA